MASSACPGERFVADASSLDAYIEYRRVVGNADGGQMLTPAEYASFRQARGLPAEPPSSARPPPLSEEDVLAIYEKRYQARRKAERSRSTSGATDRPRYAIALNLPPIALMDTLNIDDGEARPTMPWDITSSTSGRRCTDYKRAGIAPGKDGRSGFTAQLGDRARIPATHDQPEREGVVRFVGTTEFADGFWVGLELDPGMPGGKNNGMVGGVRYFSCPQGRGVFVKRARVTRAHTLGPAQ